MIPVFITLTVVLHVDHDNQPTPKVVSVYVVVAAGLTEIAPLLRFGYTRFNPGIFGVNVANDALLYHALRIAVCPCVIVGVVVLKEHADGILSMT